MAQLFWWGLHNPTTRTSTRMSPGIGRRSDHDPIINPSDDDNDHTDANVEEGRIAVTAISGEGNGDGGEEGTTSTSVAGGGSNETNSDAVDTDAQTQVVSQANTEGGNNNTDDSDGTTNSEGDTDDDPDGTNRQRSASSTLPATSSERDHLRRYETVRHLTELEEERDIRRRRNSTCTLIAVFFLFRLWVQALADSDVGLLLLSLLGTSWTIRWVQTQRETEEEIDRAIHDYIARADVDEHGALSTAAMARASAIESSDLRLMSFQAQLALAILESQRQITEGEDGSGRPGEEEVAGLDEEARGRWSRYKYRDHHHGQQQQQQQPFTSSSPTISPTGGARRKKRFGLKVKRGGYGTVPSLDSGDVDLEAGGVGGPPPEPTDPITPSSSTSSLPHPASGGIYDLSLEVQKGGADGGNDHHDKDAACSICLCEYEDGEDLLSRLPCGHIYHDDCITAWVERHVRCPLCNFDLRHEHPTELNSRSTSHVGDDSIV